jgi:hypothetical protein
MTDLLMGVSQLKDATAAFSASRYRFTLSPKEKMLLPEFKGFALRGGFGHAFRRAVCATKGACADCMLSSVCLYPEFFEPAHKQKEGKQLARPFLLEPPLDEQREYAASTELEFSLVLYGEGQEHLPHFLLAFLALGEMGLGINRARFSLLRVEIESLIGERQTIYQHGSGRLLPHSAAVTWEDVEQRAAGLPDKVCIQLLTPTLLRSDSQPQRQVDPELILRAAVRRLTQLAEDCAGANISKVDFPAIIQGAKGCSISESELSWHQLERYSSRQKQQLRLGGLVGQFVLTGSALRILLPLLVWSELTHLGKNTVFGLGQVKLAPAE